MSRINVGKLILGGVVAGVVANALDFVIHGFLMANEGQDMVQRLNLSREIVEGTGSMVTWIVVDFIWGLLLVFTYAGIRPRFGPGPKTAVIAGVVLWLAVAVTFAGLASMGIYTQQAFMKGAALQLVSSVLASLAGAAVYKE